jgi:hypothetical protein
MTTTSSPAAPASTAPRIAVHYHGGSYRLHSENCADSAREIGHPQFYPAGSTLAEIATAEFGDFIAEDPDYYTPEVVASTFAGDARILPCAAALIQN